ncbi:PIN domain-containing protein [Catenuloplanes sp. NPDC051500]|uniref:PIN domain-containing protein n=1 Tax=Catenuloplanes sp. NPDC051500 TaxID=3363959 RepID=UPI0037A1D4FC
MFTALLDTCVLWPSKQRDFLLSLAVEGMYRPTWSSVVLEELEYHEAVKLHARQGLTEADAGRRAATLIERMRAAFSDAGITGFESLEGTVGLPDPDDEHVVAAAVIAGAGAIVTRSGRSGPMLGEDDLLDILSLRYSMHGAVELIRQAR